MPKWYDEEYAWEIEVIGYIRGNSTVHYCRNGEEIGDKYTCTYGCPVNEEGQGICSKCMMLMFAIMEAVRSGGNLGSKTSCFTLHGVCYNTRSAVIPIKK